jgi:hypothetical protein
MSKTTPELYQEREKRVMDAIALEKPDRVPVLALFGSFAAQYGGITHEEEMYDVEKHFSVHFKTHMDFQPDVAGLALFLGPVLEALDFRQVKWAGHGLPADAPFQFVEGEYMKAEEYDTFLYDRSDFIFRIYWPRVFGKLQIFGHLPPIRSIISYYMGAQMGFMAFGLPGAVETLEALRRAGEETVRYFNASMAYFQRLQEAGFPALFVGASQAPFDTLGDFFRGTRGLMLDMYRRPDQVLKACEKLLPMMLENAIVPAKMSKNPRVFIPLHKGQEGFMSLEQFKKFYWPTFRELLVGLVSEDLTPLVLVEGSYTSRLDIIKDVPEGKICYWFENTDMVKAKEVLGGKVCIMGSVPMSLLVGGTPDQVRTCCKSLIDTVGKDGGYIMSSSAQLDDAKPENVKAMFEFTKEYGVY